MVSNVMVKGVYFHKAYSLVWREVLYNILLEYGLSMKLMRLKKVLNETYSKIWVGKHFSDNCPIMNVEMGGCSVNVALKLWCRTVITKTPANHEV